MSTLTQYIHAYFQLSEEQAQALSGLFQETELARDDFFCREGSHRVPLSFVREGHLRVFQYRDGKDITQWITSEGEFITDLSELLTPIFKKQLLTTTEKGFAAMNQALREEVKKDEIRDSLDH